MAVSQNTPKWSFLAGKPHGCWVPPFLETPKSTKSENNCGLSICHCFVLGLEALCSMLLLRRLRLQKPKRMEQICLWRITTASCLVDFGGKIRGGFGSGCQQQGNHQNHRRSFFGWIRVNLGMTYSFLFDECLIFSHFFCGMRTLFSTLASSIPRKTKTLQLNSSFEDFDCVWLVTLRIL